jgi:hypothetical protein
MIIVWKSVFETVMVASVDTSLKFDNTLRTYQCQSQYRWPYCSPVVKALYANRVNCCFCFHVFNYSQKCH